MSKTNSSEYRTKEGYSNREYTDMSCSECGLFSDEDPCTDCWEDAMRELELFNTNDVIPVRDMDL